LKPTLKSVIVIQFVLTLLTANAGAIIATSESFSDPFFLAQQSSGPSFDVTLMPGFADLVPGTEPVTLALELRVGVTDPDGVSTVIGSYKNDSSSTWTNVSMNRDDSTTNPDDYVAIPLNYTIVEINFIVVWDIVFYANDSLGQWSTSDLHQISVSRQGSNSTNNNEFQILAIVTGTIGLVTVMILAVYLFHQRKKQL
jgi:hypothetical protein